MNILEMIAKLRKTADALEDIFDPNPNKEKEKAFKVALSGNEMGLGKTNIQFLGKWKEPSNEKQADDRMIRLKAKKVKKHWTQTAKGKKLLSRKMKAAWKLKNKEKAK